MNIYLYTAYVKGGDSIVELSKGSPEKGSPVVVQRLQAPMPNNAVKYKGFVRASNRVHAIRLVKEKYEDHG